MDLRAGKERKGVGKKNQRLKTMLKSRSLNSFLPQQFGTGIKESFKSRHTLNPLIPVLGCLPMEII